MSVVEVIRNAVRPGRDEATRYECPDCGREFAYRADLPDLRCPYCDSPGIARAE